MKIVNKGAAKIYAREHSKDANGNVIKNGGKEYLFLPDAIIDVSDELAARLLRYRNVFKITADGVVQKETPIIKIPSGVGQSPTPEAIAVAKKGK